MAADPIARDMAAALFPSVRATFQSDREGA